MIGFSFSVTDKQTGKYPDVEQIALTEEWAKSLIYCDISGFVMGEDGNLYLADDCGNIVCCPPDRFDVKMCKEIKKEQI